MESVSPAQARRTGVITLTGRGGIVVLFVATALGALLGVHTVQGLLFCAGCLFAAMMTRKSDLLTVTVSPPAIFFIVSLIGAFVDGVGARSFTVSVLVSIGTSLSVMAPWLFIGTLIMVAGTLSRGLMRNVADLRARVAADNPFRRADNRLRRRAEARFGRGEDPVRWDEDPNRRARSAPGR